jgi:hypothetical protein
MESILNIASCDSAYHMDGAEGREGRVGRKKSSMRLDCPLSL